MYVYQETVQIDWVLPPTDTVITIDDIGILIVIPNFSTLLLGTPAVFVAPTATESGLVTFNATASILGKWEFILVLGTSTNYTSLGKVEMFVENKDTIVQPVGYAAGSLAL